MNCLHYIITWSSLTGAVFHFTFFTTTGSLAPMRASSSLLILPELSATSGAEMKLSALLPMSTAVSPALTPSIPVISTISWSIHIRPITGAILPPMRTPALPQERVLGKPSA